MRLPLNSRRLALYQRGAGLLWLAAGVLSVLLLISTRPGDAAPRLAALPAGSDVTLHIGMLPLPADGTATFLVRAVNRGSVPLEDVAVTHVSPSLFLFLPERSGAQCTAQPDDPSSVHCSLTGPGKGFRLGANQSITFTLAYGVTACASPLQLATVLRRVSSGEEAAAKTTDIMLPCDTLPPYAPSPSSSSASSSLLSSSVSSIPAPMSSARSLPAFSARPPVSIPAAPPCPEFCTERDGERFCTTMCVALPASPALRSLLCPAGQTVQSFDCVVFPRTSRDGVFPRTSCSYQCAPGT